MIACCKRLFLRQMRLGKNLVVLWTLAYVKGARLCTILEEYSEIWFFRIVLGQIVWASGMFWIEF